jgi:hypothetical protein
MVVALPGIGIEVLQNRRMYISPSYHRLARCDIYSVSYMAIVHYACLSIVGTLPSLILTNLLSALIFLQDFLPAERAGLHVPRVFAGAEWGSAHAEKSETNDAVVAEPSPAFSAQLGPIVSSYFWLQSGDGGRTESFIGESRHFRLARLRQPAPGSHWIT